MTATVPPTPKPRYTVRSSMSAHADQPRPKVMHWGPPFAGKTQGALSYPGPFFIYFDPNVATLEKHPRAVPYVLVNDLNVQDALADDVSKRRMSAIAQSLGFLDYKVETIIVDSSTFQSNKLDAWLQAKGVKGVNFWDTKKQTLRSFYMDLGEATAPLAGKEHYGLVVTAHEKVLKNEEGAVIAVTNQVTGGFGDELFQFMDVVLLFGLELQSAADGSLLKGKHPQHVIYTQPPDKHRRSVGDRIGGGRFGKLPPKLLLPEGASLYQTLASHWFGDAETAAPSANDAANAARSE